MAAPASTILAAAFTITAVIYGALHVLLSATQDAKEPPIVPAAIPFVSSIIGLSKKKSRYYTELRYVFVVSTSACDPGLVASNRSRQRATQSTNLHSPSAWSEAVRHQ
jgi:hypothetical protein